LSDVGIAALRGLSVFATRELSEDVFLEMRE
jgi:hypothetical protein